MSLMATISNATQGKIFTTTGLAVCVCVPKEWTMRQVEEFANQEKPLGYFRRWFVDEDLEFFDGRSNPCVCDDDAGRRHYLLVNN